MATAARRIRTRVLPPQIRPVSASPKVSMLIYGNPGVGKTRLIGTGRKTLILRPPTDHVDSIVSGTDVQEWVLHNWPDMLEAQEYLRHCQAGEWDWVWLDSISLWQDHGIDDIWAGVVAAKPARNLYGIDKGEYGNNMYRLGSWVRHLVGLETFHFGLTAHPAELPDVNGEILLQPWIQGKNMSPKICGYMNVVGFMEVRLDQKTGKTYRVLRFHATDRFVAKDQFSVFNGPLREPSMPKIIERLNARSGRPTPRRPAARRTTRSTN